MFDCTYLAPFLSFSAGGAGRRGSDREKVLSFFSGCHMLSDVISKYYDVNFKISQKWRKLAALTPESFVISA